MYAKRYTDETTYQVIEYYEGGSRVIPTDQHDYAAWLAQGNTPTVEAAGRFLSVVDNQIVVDPNKAAILAAESAAQAAIEAARAAKAQEIIDNLPSWSAINTAIDGATTIAQLKVIVKKLARVVYWDIKNTGV